jgi:hypothetical protein
LFLGVEGVVGQEAGLMIEDDVYFNVILCGSFKGFLQAEFLGASLQQKLWRDHPAENEYAFLGG